MWQLKVVLEVETITKQIFSSSLPTEYIQNDLLYSIEVLNNPALIFIIFLYLPIPLPPTFIHEDYPFVVLVHLRDTRLPWWLRQ